jgi:hypothetical protein
MRRKRWKARQVGKGINKIRKTEVSEKKGTTQKERQKENKRKRDRPTYKRRDK